MPPRPLQARPAQAEMPARVAAPDGARIGRVLQWAAVVVAVGLAGSVSVAIAGHVWNAHGAVIAVGVAAATVTAVPLWILGGRRYRVAGHLLSVWQGKLFLTVPGRPARSVDLSRARVTVELVGGVRARGSDEPLLPKKPVHSDLSIRPGRYFVPLHPVLRVEDRENANVIVVELCDVASRRMRDREQLAALAEVVGRAVGARHAAGQLRTLTRWQRLPHIIDADPDAIPSTPADRPPHAQVLPTAVRAGVPAAEIRIGPGPGPARLASLRLRGFGPAEAVRVGRIRLPR